MSNQPQSVSASAGERLANLKRLFSPRSIAIVGASASADKAGYQAVASLKEFKGEIFPVNPKAGEILGYKAYPSLKAIGKSVDLVIFAVPAAACAEAVREAAQCGCGGGLIMSGGYAEAGPEGAAIQEQIKVLCRETNFRLLGPNTAGFVNTHESLIASFAAGTEYIRRGHVAVLAQSSGINFMVSFFVSRPGYGVSCAVGVGNAADTDVADVLEFLSDDPNTKAIALHLEGLPNGRRVYDALKRVTPRKPVVVLPVGREDVGDFAQSHTGNLIGSYELKRNALRQAGAITVSTTEELASAATVLSLHRLAPQERPGIGVLTGQGGAGLIMLDLLKAADVDVPTLRDATLTRIAALLPPMTYLKNPVDTARPGPTFPDVLAALAADEQIDATIAFALHEPATLHPQNVVPPIQHAVGKPIIFGTAGAEECIRPTLDGLRTHGVYGAESPERLAQAAIVLVHDAIAQWRLAQPVSSIETTAAQLAPGTKVDEHSAKRLLDAYGIATTQRIACTSHGEALTAFRSLAKPVVAKILSVEIAHKTEVGGVQLHIADEAALGRALEALDRIPLKGVRRYLLESMAAPGLEMIVGAVRDASFGPTVMVGLGGTIAEAIKDTTMRIAPVSIFDARQMLGELRGSALLDGWRGSPKLDRDSLAQTIVRLAAVLDSQPEIIEIEINPLRVYARGVLALDALVATR
jgi:acetyltransferase